MENAEIESSPSKSELIRRCTAWPEYLGKAIATVAICAMGAYCMWATKGSTGIGWAVLGITLVWAC